MQTTVFYRLKCSSRPIHDGWSSRSHHPHLLFGALLLLLVVVGCETSPKQSLLREAGRLEMSRARVRYATLCAEQDKPVRGDEGNLKTIDRSYLLNRMRLMLLTLAEGYIASNENTVQELFELLRIQGLNRDKTIASVVLNEDLKTWKGEPFEQAMAFCYIGMHYAIMGDWGNMRAATENSIFYLRDFTHENASLTAEQLVDQMVDGHVADSDYQAVESNFTLGCLLNAIANQQLDLTNQSGEMYARVIKLAPQLRQLVRTFQAGEYNAVFVVDYGLGPKKTGTGPDDAIARFIPVDRSGPEPLVVQIGSHEYQYPQVIDLNTIASELMWNNLEDIRLAKSYIGSALVTAGASIADSGARRDSEESEYLGYGLVLAGMLSKSGAHADTRYCEMMPQRVYVVPAFIPEGNTTVRLYVQDKPGASITLADVPAPSPNKVNLHYVRLPSSLYEPPNWARTGQVMYGNEFNIQADSKPLPFIFGGHSVLPPTYQSLTLYQQAGYLRQMTLSQLQDLYRAERIEWEPKHGDAPGLHILEGGQSMIAPMPGTVGYTRLFCNHWPAYIPKSKELKAFLANEQLTTFNQAN